jgi:hypothetical protein
MRVISRFAGPALDEPAPDQRVKLFKELARLRASELKAHGHRQGVTAGAQEVLKPAAARAREREGH